MTKVSILQIIAVVVGNFKSCRNSVFDHLQHQIKVSTIYKRHPKKSLFFANFGHRVSLVRMIPGLVLF